jgi:hypothetical protein
MHQNAAIARAAATFVNSPRDPTMPFVIGYPFLCPPKGLTTARKLVFPALALHRGQTQVIRNKEAPDAEAIGQEEMVSLSGSILFKLLD